MSDAQDQRPTVTVTSIDDFLKVPSNQLSHCLQAFRAHIEGSRSAQRAELGTFTWTPKARVGDALQVTAVTPLSELGLRPSAIPRLAALHLLCLEDCSQISEMELLTTEGIGRQTVETLCGHLATAGLAFSTHGNPVIALHDRARQLRKQPLGQRAAGITLASEVAELGLKHQTFKFCIRHGLKTVGHLVVLQARDFNQYFGPESAREVFDSLASLGLGLAGEPTPLELWRCGLRRTQDMHAPANDASVVDLLPWLGTLTLKCQRAGIRSVDDLRRAAVTGLDVKGMGTHAWQKVERYFSVRREPKYGTNPVDAPVLGGCND